MNKELLILTLSGQLVAACINRDGVDSITSETISKCKDIASKVLSDISL